MQTSHTLVHDVARCTLDAGRVLWSLLGDFRKTYPKVWRKDLLGLLSEIPNLNGGCMVLLSDIIEKEDVIVTLSQGWTKPALREGLPEGGHVSPSTYVKLPDDLLRYLNKTIVV